MPNYFHVIGNNDNIGYLVQTDHVSPVELLQKSDVNRDENKLININGVPHIVATYHIQPHNPEKKQISFDILTIPNDNIKFARADKDIYVREISEKELIPYKKNLVQKINEYGFLHHMMTPKT